MQGVFLSYDYILIDFPWFSV